MPQTAALRHRLPTATPRRRRTRGGPGRTLGGGSTVQRGQLKPRTLTLRTSHFPDPPPATLQLTDSALLTQRGAVYTGVPIVPVVSIGAQETQLFVSRGDRLAKRLGLHRIRLD